MNTPDVAVLSDAQFLEKMLVHSHLLLLLFSLQFFKEQADSLGQRLP
jgi:hypothetical protein